MFLGLCARNTEQIWLGHAGVLSPPGYNQLVRVAERISTLDLISSGQANFGVGESASRVELEGYGVDLEQKKAMWTECGKHTAIMMVMDPCPGSDEKFFGCLHGTSVPNPIGNQTHRIGSPARAGSELLIGFGLDTDRPSRRRNSGGAPYVFDEPLGGKLQGTIARAELKLDAYQKRSKARGYMR
ncbi:LLM class flavin-dependent oxidoreductase [Alphaproteobacteria bacterium]|nr:LLM class flavin-dependent oxidoreductase [Alphaproteobacteria bacterium]